ncbi:MAG: hypothetical protein L0229_20425 [Blastocatellia bacterium]|nr:hypothetical protein [Blastocatellia bacterium]
MSKNDCILIRIPYDPEERIQVWESGHLVIDAKYVQNTTLPEYCERGTGRRRDALLDSEERVVKHPMMTVEREFGAPVSPEKESGKRKPRLFK